MGPNSFDCSGLTNYVYRQVTGRDIGGWTVPQEAAGVQIPVSQAQPVTYYSGSSWSYISRSYFNRW